MRSKNVRRSPAAPLPRGGQRTNQILAVVGLLIVGALVALSAEKLTGGTSPGASASDAPLSSDIVDASPLGSDAPVESVAPVSPILEGAIPQTVNGVTLTIQSATDATNLSSGPNGRALNGAVVHLGKQASDLEVALGYDASGALDLTIVGFRVDGIDAATLTPIIMEAWLSANTPGVTTSTVTLAGTTATKVDYGDSGSSEYLIVKGDSVFVIETSDASLAAGVAQAIETGSPAAVSASSAPGASAPPESSPATSP